MACLPGSVTLASTAPSASMHAAHAAQSVQADGHMEAMHHGMAMGDHASTHGAGVSNPSAATSSESPAEQHQPPCPDRHSLGSCASMPSCSAVAALPVADGPPSVAAEHAVVAAIPFTAPRAWGAAPELPPPRA